MFHIVMLGIIATLSFGGWALIRTSPRVLSMFLPTRLTFGVGAGLFVVAGFCAFCGAYIMREPDVMLGSMVQGFVGLWLMLATTSGARGSYGDDQMLRRLFIMVGLAIVVVVASLYVRDGRLMALLNLGLICGGYLVVRDYLRYLDRGR
jgi:hypothetical protein